MSRCAKSDLTLETRQIASDDEYTLFGVVTFKRVHDEFIQKCRENKYVAMFNLPCIMNISTFTDLLFETSSSQKTR